MAVLMRTAARFSQKTFFKNHPSVGVELDGLALPGEVKLDLLYRKSSSAHFLYMENAFQKEMLMGNSVWARFGTRFYS